MNSIRIRLLASAGALMLMLFPISGARAATTLNFEDKAAGTVIANYYAQFGVVVGPIVGVIDTQPKPHSGTHVLVASHGEFYSGPFVINFNSGQSHVSLFAGATSEIQNLVVRGTVRAFDANGKQIAQDGPKLTVANACATRFDLRVASPTVVRIEIFLATTDQNGNQTELPEAIDDLTFEGDPPPPVAKTPPVVQITSPVDQQQLDGAVFIVSGTVTGGGLPQTATLTHEVQQAQNKPHLPPLVTLVPLGGKGQTLNFSIPVKLGLGPQTLTVNVENDGGLKGTAQVHFTNLAAGITAQFGASGGIGTFGILEWVVAGDGCTLAVYDHGAISDDGVTRTVLDGIFDKWLQWILAKYSQIYAVGVGSFCPTEDERNAPGASRAQTFRKGRIYTQLAGGTLYVPAVFAEAIDLLGGEAATGVPLTDPKSSPAAKTWLFQQFVRPGGNSVASTLEIKGDAPALWVERQGGDLTALAEAGQPITANSPTLVQSFPCDSREGPCTVTAPSSPAGVHHASSAGFAYCAGQLGGGITPEWSAIQGDYTITPLLGIVKASAASDKDNPLTHENIFDELPFPSDWVVLVVPVHPFKSVLARNKDIEVEVEEYFAHYFFVGWGFPQAGDLFFASGRWIIDCGHDSFNSEIHPPFVTADMRTQKGISGPQTVANIWVNGFYTGGPVDVDLFPPPRPAPNSFLVVNKPFDAQAAVDVTVAFTTDPDSFSFVRPHFTASQRHVEVTYMGEMKFHGGREYMGRWTVGWQIQGQIPIQDLNNNWWP